MIRLYGPALILVAWAIFAIVAGDTLMPVWLTLLAVTLAAQARMLWYRYKELSRG